MGFVLFLVFMLVLINSLSAIAKLERDKLKKGGDANSHVVIEEAPKFCPPHKWHYQEVKDLEGNTVKWRMVCDLCGPLKPSNGPARME
jgi:hypothetical protein